MFNRKPKTEETQLDVAINTLYGEMAGFQGESKEYAQLTKQLSKLHKLQKEQNAPKWNVSADTLVLAGANILGIAMIVGHERAHVVTSKAIAFIQKTR